MTDSSFDRVREIFAVATKQSADRRAAFLDEACGDDDALRAEVLALLASDQAPHPELQTPALGHMDITVELSTVHRRRSDALARVGSTIGDYRLVEELGEGGFGIVFAAEQFRRVKRLVALKIIKLGMDTDQVITRFEAERQALARMNHPNIASVLDAGATETGRPYFVMELVRGAPITEFCDRASMTLRQRLRLFCDVCTAVHHAHQKGIIHRDLKPNNVLVTEEQGSPAPKVIDFGIAKATNARLTDATMFTEQGQLMGTPAYMSPEQADPHCIDIDTRTDVYSLGVLLYELLTGTTPYDTKHVATASLAKLQRMILDEQPPRLSARLSALGPRADEIAGRRRCDIRQLCKQVRGELEWIVLKALEKEKDRRYGSADELARDIERFLTNQPIVARPASAMYQFRKLVLRHKAPFAFVGVLFVLISAFAVWMSVLYTQAEQLRREAVAAKDAEQEQRERAEKTAGELKQVSDFQADMLAQIDPTQAGVELTRDVLAKFADALAEAGETEAERAKQVAAFKGHWSRVNATDAARELIDRTILKPAIGAIDERFKDQPLVDAQLRQTLANRYRELGLYDAALPLQTSALDTRRRVLGNDHLETLASINDMGHQLEVQGRLDEAMPFYREALDTCRRILGDDHSQTLSSINNMGLLLQRRGKLDEAEPYFREGLAVSRRVRGDEHPGTLTYISNMGQLLDDQGKLDEAEPYHREALEGKRRVLGDDHPDTLTSINNMGLLLHRQGKLDEAEPYHREALEGQRRALGDDHPLTLISITNMGMLLRELGKLDEAERYLRQAVEGYRRVLGDEHASTLRSLGNLAFFFERSGRYTEAEPYCREALNGKRRVLGDDHPDTLISISNMAKLLVEIGKGEEAERLARESVDRGKAALGEAHWFVGNFLGKHGLALALLGRHAEAEEALLEGHGILVAGLGDDHEQTRRVVGYLADCYDARHAVEPDKGYDAKSAEWQAKLPTKDPGEEK